MLYVVHVIPDMKSRSFQTHKSAFVEFKAAVKRGKTVCMWASDAKGQWTKVHYTALYPLTLTQPYVSLYDSHSRRQA